VIVHAVIDVRTTPDHPRGDAIETFIRGEDTSDSSTRYAATIPSSRATCGSRSGS
jgi:hypothetical protein